MRALHLARPQGPAAIVIDTVIHPIFKPPHMINQLPQALVGGVLMVLLPGREDLGALACPALLQMVRHPSMTCRSLQLHRTRRVIQMRLEGRMISKVLSLGKRHQDRFAQALGSIAGHHHLAQRRQTLHTGAPEELL